MKIAAEFPGFPSETIPFFESIKENNNREWFQAHRDDFIKYVQEPAIDFVIAFGTQLQSMAPSIQFDPATNGSGSLMRIYRDIRFSRDKSPYKTWLGMGFWGGSKKDHHVGVYFGLSTDGAGLHIGNHQFSKPFMLAYQRAVDDEKQGQQLVSILNGIQEKFSMEGDKYRRVPKPYANDHPRGTLLKFKALFFSTPRLTPEQVASPELLEICLMRFQQAVDFYKWMHQVGQSIS